MCGIVSVTSAPSTSPRSCSTGSNDLSHGLSALPDLHPVVPLGHLVAVVTDDPPRGDTLTSPEVRGLGCVC